MDDNGRFGDIAAALLEFRIVRPLSSGGLQGAGLTTLDRYMYRRLIRGTLAVMAILSINEILYKTKDLYRLVIVGIISVNELLTVWATILPVVFYQVGPEMVAIAVLARYYLWRQDNEILTMRSSGRSCWQIARPGIVVGACAGIFVASMSLYALPPTIGTAEHIRALAQSRVSPGMLEEGTQNTLQPGLSISFKRRIAVEIVESVVLADDRKPGKYTLIIAERGRFVQTDGIYVLVLENGDSFNRTADTSEVRRVGFKELSMPLNPPDLPLHNGGFYEQHVGYLLSPPTELRVDRRVWAACVAEGHHRIINPLRCLASVLLVLGILVPGRQGFTELAVRLGLALALTFAELSASTIIFSAAQRHVEGGPFLYLLPATSAGIGVFLLCWGDMRLYRWSRWTRIWRQPYSADVSLATPASLD
jgi:lipopolysaccharide export LptBFGC system permease protein LptF